MSQDPPSTQPIQGGSSWLPIGITLGVSLLGVFILAIGYFTSVGMGTSLRITDDDHRLLVTLHDLEPLPDNVIPRTEAVQESKTSYRDKHVVLQYRYEHPEGSTPLFLRCSVTSFLTKAEAEQKYDTQVKSGPENPFPEIVSKEAKTSVTFPASQVHRETFSQAEQWWGGFLVCQTGRHVFLLEIVGKDIEPGIVDTLAIRCLDQMPE